MKPTNACRHRLRKELQRLEKEPVAHIEARPLDSNILEWHYVITGPSDSLYKGGVYHGKLKFPGDYPYKPPSIIMITPNGRFKTNSRLCLSMSDFHPESWNPMWSVSSILSGLLSFMLETSATYGSVSTSKRKKRRFAHESLAFNAKNPTFVALFPHWKTEHQKLRQQRIDDGKDPDAFSDSEDEDDDEDDAQRSLIGRAAANFRGGVGGARHDDVRHARAGAKDWSDRLMVGVIVAVLAYALSSLYS